jgi:hypothetical protein
LDKPEWYTSAKRVGAIIKENGLSRTKNLGRGFVTAYDATSLYAILEREIMKNPYVITQKGAQK